MKITVSVMVRGDVTNWEQTKVFDSLVTAAMWVMRVFVYEFRRAGDKFSVEYTVEVVGDEE